LDALSRAAQRDGEQVCALVTRIVAVVSGGVSAHGLKHIEFLRRRVGMERQAFLTYWREVHGPLAAAIPTVRRYHQLPSTDDESPYGLPFLDGLAVLWFDSADSMRKGAQHVAYRMTREDMPRLADMELSTSLLTQELWASDQS
jgi:uncharacterized protein (TIGR02118 family)